MSEFRKLSETVWASPQIGVEDVAEAAAAKFALIINNRPDGEAPDQPDGELIAKAARDAGMEYRAIPVGQGGFSEAQVAAMGEALSSTDGKTLAYCRSGTRSTFLWSLAQAQQGEEPVDIVAAAAGAGYDVSPIKAGIDMLAAKSRA